MVANGKSQRNGERLFSASNYSDLEFEDVWETPPYDVSLEFEDEWELPATSQSRVLDSNLEFEHDGEWELQEEAHYANPEFDGEWESEDPFFSQNLLRGVNATAQRLLPVAKRLAAIAPKALLRNDPVETGLGSLLQKGDATAAEMEALFFGNRDGEMAMSDTPAAYEAALTEVLLAEASHSPNLHEATALLGAAIPSVVRSMGAHQALQPAMLPLVQVSHQLAQIFRQSGADGKKLQRLLPTIFRRVVASLKSARQAGKPINTTLIKQVMAGQTARVLKDPTTVTRAIARNAAIRKQTVKPGKPAR